MRKNIYKIPLNPPLLKGARSFLPPLLKGARSFLPPLLKGGRGDLKKTAILIFTLAFSTISFAQETNQPKKKEPTIKNCQYIEIYSKCPYQKEPGCKKWLATQKSKYCKNPQMLKGHILQEFSKWDYKLKTLSFDFTQIITYTDVDLTQNVEGKIYYQKPSMLRIEHITPEKQIIWTDKKDIYIYQPETPQRPAQAIKSKWHSWLNHTGASYFGIIDFGEYSKTVKSHNIEQIEFAADTLSLSMTPKTDPGVYMLTLVLRKTDLLPIGAKFEIENMISDININQNTLKINAKLPKDIMEIDTEGTKIEEM